MFNAHSGKYMFLQNTRFTMLLDLHKTRVNERTLNTHYSIYMFNMRFKKNTCFNHVAHFPVYVTSFLNFSPLGYTLPC